MCEHHLFGIGSSCTSLRLMWRRSEVDGRVRKEIMTIVAACAARLRADWATSVWIGGMVEKGLVVICCRPQCMGYDDEWLALNRERLTASGL